MSLTKVKSPAYPLGRANIDTDIVIGSDWLKTVTKVGLGEGAFAVLREGGDSVFDDPRFAGAQILIAGANFGCGSSREHAAWALADMGIRVVIAPSFSDIFSSNAFKNGILAAVIEEAALPALIAEANEGDLLVDLQEQTITSERGVTADFTIDPFRRRCLLEGLDEIELTLLDADNISQHETRTKRDRPWLARAGAD